MRSSNLSSKWTNIDQSKNLNEYISFLDDLNSLKAIQAYKQRTFDLLHIEKGQFIIDIGCGTGQDVIGLAGSVGADGKVIGVDISTAMINEAKRNLPERKLPAQFIVGNAESLDFPDDSFDGCRADRVLQHLEKPELALLEMLRVAKKGSKIVISEPDWQTLTVDSSMDKETSVIVTSIINSIKHPFIGRRLLGMFTKAGLSNISISTATLILNDFSVASPIFQLEYGINLAHDSKALPPKSIQKWINEQYAKTKDHQFFASLTGFAVCGTKN